MVSRKLLSCLLLVILTLTAPVAWAADGGEGLIASLAAWVAGLVGGGSHDSMTQDSSAGDGGDTTEHYNHMPPGG